LREEKTDVFDNFAEDNIHWKTTNERQRWQTNHAVVVQQRRLRDARDANVVQNASVNQDRKPRDASARTVNVVLSQSVAM
jgi:hypothetical protein